MPLCQCQVVSITQLTPHVWQVRLKPDRPMTYQAGQYLQIALTADDKRPFSLASAPSNPHELLELHIGAEPSQAYTWEVIEHLQNHSEVMVEDPAGLAWLREDRQSALLFVAGGTGFSYTHGLMEYLAQRQTKRNLHLYWGVRTSEAFYTDKPTRVWVNKIPHLRYYPIVEHPQPQWLGRRGNVIDAVLHDYTNLADHDIYIAGRFEMASYAKQAFIQRGADPKRIFGDAFEFV